MSWFKNEIYENTREMEKKKKKSDTLITISDMKSIFIKKNQQKD